MSPGKGFWTYMSTGFGGSSGNLNWAFTGTLKQGPLSVATTQNFGCTGAITGADGYNLVANPYPAPISWTKLEALNTGNYNTSVSYFPLNSGVMSSYAAGLGGTGTAQDVIPAGQGFYVEDQQGGGNLNFDESVKTEFNNHNAFRLRVSGQYDKDDALLTINPNASLNYEKKNDARKIFNTPGYGGGQATYSKYTTVSTQAPGGEYMAINYIPPTNYSLSIPVLVRVSTTGSYTLDANDFDNYQSCIVIRDKLTNIYTDLKANNYVFNINDTTNTPRFELFVCANGSAPLGVKELFANSNISISSDKTGPLVTTSFETPTDAVISVYNILGEKITADIKVSGTQTTTRINNLNLHSQVAIIKVTAANQSVSKRIIVE
jgi:hypothetical protein